MYSSVWIDSCSRPEVVLFGIQQVSLATVELINRQSGIGIAGAKGATFCRDCYVLEHHQSKTCQAALSTSITHIYKNVHTQRNIFLSA